MPKDANNQVTYGKELDADERRELSAESWIDGGVIEAAQLRRVDSETGKTMFGRHSWRGDFAGVIFPYFSLQTGLVRDYRLRRDCPEYDAKGKPIMKYVASPGRGNMLYFPPGAKLADCENKDLPVCFVEGEKKCLSLWTLAWHERTEQEGPRFLPVGLSGVWNFRGVVGKTRDEKGRRTDTKGTISDLDLFNFMDREVFICFDSDAQENESVARARENFAREVLTPSGADVRFVLIPDRSDGAKLGIDDFLALRGANAALDLFATAQSAERDAESFARQRVSDVSLAWLSFCQVAGLNNKRHETARNFAQSLIAHSNYKKRKQPFAMARLGELLPAQDTGATVKEDSLATRGRRGLNALDAWQRAAGREVFTHERGRKDRKTGELVAARIQNRLTQILVEIQREAKENFTGKRPLRFKLAAQFVFEQLPVCEPLPETEKAESKPLSPSDYEEQQFQRLLAMVERAADSVEERSFFAGHAPRFMGRLAKAIIERAGSMDKTHQARHATPTGDAEAWAADVRERQERGEIDGRTLPEKVADELAENGENENTKSAVKTSPFSANPNNNNDLGESVTDKVVRNFSANEASETGAERVVNDAGPVVAVSDCLPERGDATAPRGGPGVSGSSKYINNRTENTETGEPLPEIPDDDRADAEELAAQMPDEILRDYAAVCVAESKFLWAEFWASKIRREGFREKLLERVRVRRQEYEQART